MQGNELENQGVFKVKAQNPLGKEELMEFKVGAKVRVLDKTTGSYNIGEDNIRRGDIAEITSIGNSVYACNENWANWCDGHLFPYEFNFSDLELIKEEPARSLLTNMDNCHKSLILEAVRESGFGGIVYINDVAFWADGNILENHFGVHTNCRDKDHSLFWIKFDELKARGEDSMEYKTTDKVISLKSIYDQLKANGQDGGCHLVHFDSLIAHIKSGYHFDGEIPYQFNSILYNFIHSHSGRERWFTQNGFLAEVVVEETYARGDIVNVIKNHIVSGNPHILCTIECQKMTLVSVADGNRYSDPPFRVDNSFDIKASEIPVKVKKLPGRFVYQEPTPKGVIG